jgi:hypothetical protein
LGQTRDKTHGDKAMVKKNGKKQPDDKKSNKRVAIKN